MKELRSNFYRQKDRLMHFRNTKTYWITKRGKSRTAEKIISCSRFIVLSRKQELFLNKYEPTNGLMLHILQKGRNTSYQSVHFLAIHRNTYTPDRRHVQANIICRNLLNSHVNIKFSHCINKSEVWSLLMLSMFAPLSYENNVTSLYTVGKQVVI